MSTFSAFGSTTGELDPLIADVKPGCPKGSRFMLQTLLLRMLALDFIGHDELFTRIHWFCGESSAILTGKGPRQGASPVHCARPTTLVPGAFLQALGRDPPLDPSSRALVLHHPPHWCVKQRVSEAICRLRLNLSSPYRDPQPTRLGRPSLTRAALAPLQTPLASR